MSIKDIDGDNVTTIVVVALIVAVLATLILSIKSCYLEEIQKYLTAGCERVYVLGRADAIWSNCKKPIEKDSQ